MKNFFILLGTLLSVNLLMAQQTLAIQYDVPACQASTYEHAIGKVCSNSNAIISCHRHSNNSDFVKSHENATHATRFDLPVGMYVNDMEILNGVVYFCGSYNVQGTSKGIVGYFNENDFVYGTVNLQYVYVSEYTSLDKLEVYLDNSENSTHIAAIGHTYVSSSAFNTGLIIININGGVVNYGIVPSAIAEQSRYYTDVAVTDKYIVSVGCYACGTQGSMWINIINKTNLLQARLYKYIDYNDESNSCYYNITEMNDDYVAISTTIYSPTDSRFHTRIYKFNVAGTQFFFSQDIPIANKIMENEMQYFREDGTLLVLQTNQYPINSNQYESLIYKLNMNNTTSYTARFIYDPDAYYYSLDRYQGSKHFIATGELKEDGHTFFKRDIDAIYYTLCFSGSTENIIIKLPPTYLNDNIYPISYTGKKMPMLTQESTYKTITTRCNDIRNNEQ